MNWLPRRRLNNKQELLFTLIEDLTSSVSVVMQKFKMLDFDEKYITIYSDDEIKKYYINSGLTATDVKKLIKKVRNRDLDMHEISEIVNGKTNDLELRSLIGNYFKYEAIKKTKKNYRPTQ